MAQFEVIGRHLVNLDCVTHVEFPEDPGGDVLISFVGPQIRDSHELRFSAEEGRVLYGMLDYYRRDHGKPYRP